MNSSDKMNNRTVNLINQVKRNQDNQQNKVLPQYIVDTESGPYKTIQEAVDAADQGAIIKIAPGLYSDNVVIKKPNLILEPKEKIGDIIMVVSSKPAFYINLKEGEKCTIIGIKLSHSGNSEDLEEMEKKKAQEKYVFGLFDLTQTQDNIITRKTEMKPESELVNKFIINENIDTIILVQGGTLILEESLLSLNFVVNNYVGTIPAIVIDEGSSLQMSQVEIKGNKTVETVGIILKKANAVIKESKIQGNIMGGIAIWGTKENKICIQSSRIIFNQSFGINIVGEDNNCLIEGNKIEHNQGPGIKIGIGNKSSIIRNEIKQNQNGIEFISADPYIYMNKIVENFENGILAKSYSLKYAPRKKPKLLRCDGRIRYNISISNNKEAGILCSGNKVLTKIENNQLIFYNKKQGIKIEDQAHCLIYKNKITKNYFQGILIVENSSSYIVQNEVTDNIKANIAFGGQRSINTYLIENRITGGRQEGIFIVEGGKSHISRNTISENNDGVVLMQSVPKLMTNTIIKNKSCGIMLLKSADPEINDNLIADNDGIGLFIRSQCQKSQPIEKNILKNNEIELVIETYNTQLRDIEDKNKITGDIRIPSSIQCQIF